INGLTSPPVLPKLPPGKKYCEWGGGGNGNQKATHVVIAAEGATMNQFSQNWLNGVDGKQVIDRTGLRGKIDFRLEFAIDEELRQRYAEVTGVPLSELWTGPSIFVALQEQRGLKVDTTKAAVEVLVIDCIERPSPN